MDGSHTSNSSVSYFTDIDIGGAVHPVIKGDQRSWSIAAASNLAKQTRDSLMHRLAELYPSYGFDVNKGYPVADHLKQLKKYGLSPVHRRSYKPCAALLAEAPEEVSRSKIDPDTKGATPQVVCQCVQRCRNSTTEAGVVTVFSDHNHFTLFDGRNVGNHHRLARADGKAQGLMDLNKPRPVVLAELGLIACGSSFGVLDARQVALLREHKLQV